MKTPSLQRGATLIVMATVLVLGFAWFTVGALGKHAVTTAEREAKTAAALQSAKKALLGHVAHYAALTSFEFPGRMLCPESLSAYGNPATEGEATGACSNTSAEIGRLPWKTLGIDQLRDGDGEPLWYVLSPNFHPVSFPLNPAPPNPYLNFGTPAALPFDGANVVAVIIAPGRALQSNPCNAVNQQVSRYVTPLQPNRFFECGNATGSYTNPGSGTGSNDRVLAITQAEWADAIAGAVADRIQRQVAPAMAEFRATTSNASWGRRFLPYASTWSSSFNWPPSNNLCGNQDVYAGMPPTAAAASGSCNTNWTSASVSGLSSLLAFDGCTITAQGAVCDFTVLLGGLFAPRISVTAPRIAYSFRSFDPATVEISRNNGATWQSVATNTYSGSVDPDNGSANSRFNVVFPLLSIAERVLVRVPHPTDALLPDPRVAWFLNNGWDRFTYYAVTQAATTDPDGADCVPGGDVSECLTVTGMPSPANDKRLVLVLMGRAPISPATWPSSNLANYLEDENADGDRRFETRTVTATFNDRVAACPFQPTDGAGNMVTVCN
jgi:hypothetical protein